VRILDRYVLGEWAKIFGLCLGALAGIVILSVAYRHAPDFIDWEAGIGPFSRFLLLRIVGELPILIPVSLLVSVIFVLAQLNRSQELAAARAAGLSILRITAPLWAASGACALALAGLNASWVSVSQEAARAISDEAEFASVLRKGGEARVAGEGELVAFESGDGRRQWIIGRLSLAASRASDVHVHFRDARAREERRIVARAAEFRRVGDRWRWEFIDARELVFDPATGALLRQPRHVRLGPVDGDDPSLMAATTQRAKELSFRELAALGREAGWFPEGRMAQYAMRYHGTLASPVICLVVVAIAIPYAVVGGRVNPMIGVSKTLGLFVAYYFAAMLLNALGASGALPPVVAAWLPPLGLAAWALPRLRGVN
jgi:lipopolysaccharide export system permease protein